MNRGRWRRTLSILFVGVVPWAVLFYPGGAEAYFAYGLVTHAGTFVSLPQYLSMAVLSLLPSRLLAWPTSAVLWVLALASSGFGSHEDRRVTDGLLVFAGVSQLVFAIGFWTGEGYVAIPLGGVLLVTLAWWDHRPANRGSASPTRGE